MGGGVGELTNPGGSKRKLGGRATQPAACPQDNDPQQPSHLPSLFISERAGARPSLPPLPWGDR